MPSPCGLTGNEFTDTSADEGGPLSGDSTGSPSNEITRQGTVLGTPAYMAPELWCKESPQPRSDQFSFCVSLYEGLYGRRPFLGGQLRELGRNIVGGKILPPPPDADVPHEMWEVIRRGLAPLPSERYPSMGALLRDLDRAKLRAELRAEAERQRAGDGEPEGGVWALGDAASPLAELA